MSALFLFGVCAFASSFSMRLLDPLVLPVAEQFAITAAVAALLAPAFSLPYAASQLFLGPISDRFGRARCIRWCIAGLAGALLAGALAPSYEALFVSRVAAGIFGGGLIPLVLAAMGDAYDIAHRQVAIGRLLVATISGQMLGSLVSGLSSRAFGWRSALVIACVVTVVAAALAWARLPREAVRPGPGGGLAGTLAVYRRILGTPKAPWLLGAVFFEATMFFGVFPHLGSVLAVREPGPADVLAGHVGIAIGAFGVGGLLYALTVRRLIALLGVRRLCSTGALLAAASFVAMAAFVSWWQVALAMFFCGLAFYMLHSCLQTEATELAPTTRGSAVALFAASLFSGTAAGPLLFGPLIQAAGPGPAFLLLAIGTLLLGQVVVRRIVVDAGRPGVARRV